MLRKTVRISPSHIPPLDVRLSPLLICYILPHSNPQKNPCLMPALVAESSRDTLLFGSDKPLLCAAGANGSAPVSSEDALKSAVSEYSKSLQASPAARKQVSSHALMRSALILFHFQTAFGRGVGLWRGWGWTAGWTLGSASICSLTGVLSGGGGRGSD